ncbi:MAG: hypothetical protein HC927_10285 [Deltaproteobacteria bacterium]|nr:hypothetical protein [Deltaproteobacteria bacterium]
MAAEDRGDLGVEEASGFERPALTPIRGHANQGRNDAREHVLVNADQFFVGKRAILLTKASIIDDERLHGVPGVLAATFQSISIEAKDFDARVTDPLVVDGKPLARGWIELDVIVRVFDAWID